MIDRIVQLQFLYVWWLMVIVSALSKMHSKDSQVRDISRKREVL